MDPPPSHTILMESLINLSGSLTASAPPHAASAHKRILCLFVVKCDQAPHLINEAFAGNVCAPAIRLRLGFQLLRSVWKTEFAPPCFFFFPPQRHDERSVVCCAALHIHFSPFLFFFSQGATILSLKRVKPSLFFFERIFQMEWLVRMKKGPLSVCRDCGLLGCAAQAAARRCCGRYVQLDASSPGC